MMLLFVPLIGIAYCTAIESIQSQLDRTWNAVCWVESKGDPRAIGDNGDAIGIAQIHKEVVDDCNRILGKKKYCYQDRWNVVKSREMFRIYVRYYAPTGGPEQWSRIWNGGPKGNKKRSTIVYWKQVQELMKKK
jgi:hypothetical protein